MKKFNLLTILEIKHVDADGKILWQAKNLPNLFHQQGEAFMLNAMFLGGQANTYIPEYYYFGLDSRSSSIFAITNTMETIATYGSEPSTNGYSRQIVPSLGGTTNSFTMTTDTGAHAMALSPIVTFSASIGTGGWGPVSYLFITDKIGNDGSLIASVALNTPVSVSAGQGIHMRMGLSLGYCPDMEPVPLT
jgi:hypothetical protein